MGVEGGKSVKCSGGKVHAVKRLAFNILKPNRLEAGIHYDCFITIH